MLASVMPRIELFASLKAESLSQIFSVYFAHVAECAPPPCCRTSLKYKTHLDDNDARVLKDLNVHFLWNGNSGLQMIAAVLKTRICVEFVTFFLLLFFFLLRVLQCLFSPSAPLCTSKVVLKSTFRSFFFSIL